VTVFYWLLKRILIGPFLRLFFRPWVEGAENLPDAGPAILASNHLSFSDSLFLPLVATGGSRSSPSPTTSPDAGSRASSPGSS
jgi:1-acyl-sn-glycerol-3-phosphate acyltransferase